MPEAEAPPTPTDEQVAEAAAMADRAEAVLRSARVQMPEMIGPEFALTVRTAAQVNALASVMCDNTEGDEHMTVEEFKRHFRYRTERNRLSLMAGMIEALESGPPQPALVVARAVPPDLLRSHAG